jgi:S-methyl-5-thioribose-1-phosphate isomerase
MWSPISTLPINDRPNAEVVKPAGDVYNFDESKHSWQSAATQDRAIHSVIYDHDRKSLKVLDQLLLPYDTVFIEVSSVDDAFNVIKRMQVRGAPLIATVGTLGLGIELEKNGPKNYNELLKFIDGCCEKLIASRPTAVNLRNAIRDIQKIIDIDKNETSNNAARLIERIQNAAFEWFLNERSENNLLLKNATICVESNYANDEKLTVMTVCNTGSLATSSHGTALGVIRQLHFRGHLKLAIALETRPYNQGSRLTAYELLKENIPFVLIADNMAAAAMQNYKIDAILVGADQVALNGDTANKIGTYMLSVLANFHRVPFYVVTPTSSINSLIKTGAEIRIEERPPQELITFNDKLTAPKDTPVWNPAFDITPGKLITGILTEKGNCTPANVKNLF